MGGERAENYEMYINQSVSQLAEAEGLSFCNAVTDVTGRFLLLWFKYFLKLRKKSASDNVQSITIGTDALHPLHVTLQFFARSALTGLFGGAYGR